MRSVHLLASNFRDRLGVYSFYIDNLHYNLGVKLMNDKYGIQVRGGCSCAGTYGHILLEVGINESKKITDKINKGDLTLKPGWIRMSIHPTMTNLEVEFIMNAIEEIAQNHRQWANDYVYNKIKNDFIHKSLKTDPNKEIIKNWFTV